MVSEISDRIEQLRKEIDEEGEKWQRAGLPGPKPMYRMNDDEFMHHCHLLALTRLIKDRLELTDDEINVYLHEEFLKQMKDLYQAAIQARRDAIRQSLVHGVKIVPPKIDPEI